MGFFYLDIETTGTNPKVHKIVTIQYQELERNTGKAIGELKILKEWESSEKNILTDFLANSKILDPYQFTFIPVGYKLGFENNFLKERTTINGLSTVDILNGPFLDLRSIGILMNKGEFKGSGLDKITGKIGDGSQVPIWYNNKEYDKIITYVKKEAEEFIKLNIYLHDKLPSLLLEFKREYNIL